MKALPPDLADVARLNPVPLDSLAGAHESDHAKALLKQILADPPPQVRARRRGRRIVLAVAALVVLCAGTGVAARMLTQHDVERFLPQGSTVFIGTNPTCVAVTPGIEYRCRLATAPTHMDVTGPEGQPAFKGAKFGTVDDDHRVNGGCLALNDAGTSWACYLGARAVQEHILDEGVLGQRVTGPAAG